MSLDLEVGPPVELTDLTVGEPVRLTDLILGDPIALPTLTVSADGQRVWTAHGVPDVIPGAWPGDLYLDLDTGTLYRLA